MRAAGRYEGEWRENNQSGHGTHTWPDGKRCEKPRLTAEGLRAGTDACSGRYEGEFREGYIHGHGTHTLPDGQRCEHDVHGHGAGAETDACAGGWQVRGRVA